MPPNTRKHFGDHAYDEEGNYIGTAGSEGQQAWEDYFSDDASPGDAGDEGEDAAPDSAGDEGEDAAPDSAGDEVQHTAEELADET